MTHSAASRHFLHLWGGQLIPGDVIVASTQSGLLAAHLGAHLTFATVSPATCGLISLSPHQPKVNFKHLSFPFSVPPNSSKSRLIYLYLHQIMASPANVSWIPVYSGLSAHGFGRNVVVAAHMLLFCECSRHPLRIYRASEDTAGFIFVPTAQTRRWLNGPDK